MAVEGTSKTVLEEIGPEAKLICGVIARDDTLPRIEIILERTFGKVDSKCEPMEFAFTNYYEKEMGTGLWRTWVSFEGGISQSEIVRSKLKAIGLERELVDGEGNRTTNLDPGYLTGSKLVLASTKNFSHRIYLWGGIFGEVTLVFEHGSFIPLKWTYPDYRTDHAISYFNGVREDFLRV